MLKAGKSIYDAATCYNRQAHQLTEDAVVYAEEELSSEKGVVWKIAYAKNGEKKTGFILAGDAKDADADAYKNASDHASLEYKGYYLPDVSMKASPDEEKAAQPAVEEVVEPVVTEEAAVVEPAVAAEPAVEEAKAEEPKMAPAAEATSEEKAPAPVEPTKNEPAQKSMQSAKTRAVSTTAPVILQQPANLADVVPGASAQFKVTGNADSYQWQVNRNDGKGFVNLNESSTWKGTQTDTLTFTAKSAQAAFTFRVVLTTGAGTLESNAVHITFLTAPVISVEPADQTVENAGDTAAFTVVADQAPTYQWQVDRGDGKGFVNLSETVTWRGVTTDTLQFTTKPAQLGFTFRVVVSNAVGSVNSAVVKFTWANPPTILSQTTQEELGEIAVGTTATVKVTGSATTEAYQWEVDRGDGNGFEPLNDGTTWSGTKTNTLNFKVKTGQAGFQLRAKLTNDAGETYSTPVKVVLMTVPVISVEPADQTVENAGDTAAFTVVVDKDATYQWQVDRGDGKGFVNLNESVTWRGVTTDTLQFTTKPAQRGFTFRVVVSNAVGSVNSAVVKFTWANPPTILSQTTQEELGELVLNTTATVKVTGSATTEAYQWEVDRGDGNGFEPLNDGTTWSGTKTNTLNFKVKAGQAGFQLRAKLTNSAGETNSAPVEVTILPKPIISVQPEAKTITEIGDSVAFTVVAEKEEDYQWQVDRGDGKGFVNLNETATWSGTQTETLTFKSKLAQMDFQFRVVLTNASGTTTSDVVSFTWDSEPTIVTPPESMTDILIGDRITFHVVGSANTETYQWQVDRDDGNGFVNLKDSATWAGTKTDTLTFVSKEAQMGFKFRVVLSNRMGETISNEVYFATMPAPVISLQPVSVEVENVGDNIQFHAEAENATGYQWQVDRGDGKSFVNLNESATWNGTTTKTLSFNVKAAQRFFQFRLVASNAGGKAESDVVGFTWKNAPTITVEPADVEAAIGDAAAFTIDDNGIVETYQWQVDRGDGQGFVNLKESATFTGTTTKTLTVAVKAGNKDFRFRVVLTNNVGSVTSEDAGLVLVLKQNDVLYDFMPDSITTAYVKEYQGSAASVVIPEQVFGLTVVEIGADAFMGNTALVSIDLPDTIQVIRERAFKNCSNLKEMN